MEKRKNILKNIESDEKVIRDYAIEYFKCEKISDLDAINKIIDMIEISDDKLEILDYLRMLDSNAFDKETLIRLFNINFYDEKIKNAVDLLIAYANIELLKNNENIRPMSQLGQDIMKKRFEYYDMDFDIMWKQLWNMDHTHPDFENDYQILTAISDRPDFNYDKFHKEISIEAISGYEQVKTINLCQLAGMLKDKDMINYVIEQVYTGSDNISEIASKELIKIGDKRIIKLIKENYKNVSRNVKISLLNILEGIKLKSSEDLLLEIYKNETDIDLKIQIIFALVSHLSKKAISLLEKELNNNPTYKIDYIESLYVLYKFYNIENENLEKWKKMIEKQNKKMRDLRVNKFHKDNPNILDQIITSESETFVRKEKKIGRNDPCPCGSGKKYKKCCIYK
ncbi:MAG: SEC-C metal-binding domain-containing protein [Bacillota bacterium]